MVGLIAGMANLDNAFLRAEACISRMKGLGTEVHYLMEADNARRERIRASWEAMEGSDELQVKEWFVPTTGRQTSV